MWSNDSYHYNAFGESSPMLADTLGDDQRLTKSHDSRPSRLPATVPDSSTLLTDLQPRSAIPAAQTHSPNNNLLGQDVCELVNSLPSPSPASHIPVSPSLLLETSVSSLFNQHGLTQSNSRLRTSNQVFQTGEELALHYGIPTLLPPPPTVQKKNPLPFEESPVLDFDTLRANYLNMISQKPSETPMSVDPIIPAELLPSSHMDQEFLEELLTSPQWEYLTSPVALGTPAQDFESSPDETPLNDFLNTPLLDAGDDFFASPAFNSDLALFATDEPFYTAAPASVKTKSAELPPELPDSLIAMPPIPDTDTIDPNSLYSSPPLAASPSSFHPVDPSSSTTTTTFASTTRRTRANATGTRKNISPEKLIPLDAPTQPRRYITPSVTSKKDVPAVFQRKRQRSEMEDEQDELEPLPPNATEREQIEYKRRQNTLAARKSRKRKLMYQQELETSNAELTGEVTMWKTRCDVLRKMLESHGIPPPSFTD